MCPRWLESFENFLADMGPRPEQMESIERINNNGNYEPGNCRWATMKEQTHNRRSSRIYTAFGVTACLSELCRIHAIKKGTVRYRLEQGYVIEEALTRADYYCGPNKANK